ncbi:MAG: M14 family zinc carboxypeptidase [Bradymonadales bacterium]
MWYKNTYTLVVLLCTMALFFVQSELFADEYCSADSKHERLIIGLGAQVQNAHSLGKWIQDDDGLRVESMRGARDAFWFSENKAPFNAFLRLRWQLGARADGSFFWRAKFEKDALPMLSGYSVGVEVDKLVIYRWDEGTPRAMASSLTLDTKTVKVVEFVIFNIGSQLSIQVYDADTLQLLGNFNLNDGTYMQGHIGFRAYRRQSSDSVFQSLSIIDASQEQQPEASLIGPNRYVWLTASDRAQLSIPSGCVALDKAPVEPRLYRCTQAQYELLKRATLALNMELKATGTVSHSMLDANFREKKKQWPVADETGYDVLASYQDAEMVESLLRAYAKRYPKKAKLVRIGKSVLGRGIYALVISKKGGGQKPTVMLNGAHHGMELLATDFVFDSIKILLENPDKDPEIDAFVEKLEIWCIPLVNPDGNHLHIHESTSLGRKNARDVYDESGEIRVGAGVDLNRNYPLMWGKFKERASSSKPKHYWYRGEKPASEPETQAMMNMVNTKQFTSAISYHTVSTKILVPYSIDGMTNPKPDEAWPIAELMASAAGIQSNDKPYAVVKNIYNVDGCDQDWFRWVAGTTAFLIEGSQHNPLKQELRRDTVLRNREAWKTLLRRTMRGPSIYGTVKDQDGKALVAKVEIIDIKYAHDENWTSRCSDGAFERLVPGKGTYTVRASIDGAVEEKQVTLAEERKRIDFVLQKPENYSLAKTLCPDEARCSTATLRNAKRGRCPRI